MKSLNLAVLLCAMASSTMALAAPAAVAAAAKPVAPASNVAAAPGATQIQAVQAMLAAMQAEKMMRTTAGASRYANDAQRQAVMDKLLKVPAGEIHQRLAAPVARFVSTETALEMSKFYASTYGQKLLQQTYNGGPSMYGVKDPVPVGPEKAQLKSPALIKARTELAAVEPQIKHEAFVLLGAISKAK